MCIIYKHDHTTQDTWRTVCRHIRLFYSLPRTNSDIQRLKSCQTLFLYSLWSDRSGNTLSGSNRCFNIINLIFFLLRWGVFCGMDHSFRIRIQHKLSLDFSTFWHILMRIEIPWLSGAAVTALVFLYNFLFIYLFLRVGLFIKFINIYIYI